MRGTTNQLLVRFGALIGGVFLIVASFGVLVMFPTGVIGMVFIAVSIAMLLTGSGIVYGAISESAEIIRVMVQHRRTVQWANTQHTFIR